MKTFSDWYYETDHTEDISLEAMASNAWSACASEFKKSHDALLEQLASVMKENDELKTRLGEADGVIYFYSDPESYRETSEDEWLELHADHSRVDTEYYIGLYGGKKARAYQSKYLTKENK